MFIGTDVIYPSFFMRIQNLVTVLEILFITENMSQKWRHTQGDSVCRQHYSMNDPFIDCIFCVIASSSFTYWYPTDEENIWYKKTVSAREQHTS